jgi:hypothetical protein
MKTLKAKCHRMRTANALTIRATRVALFVLCLAAPACSSNANNPGAAAGSGAAQPTLTAGTVAASTSGAQAVSMAGSANLATGGVAAIPSAGVGSAAGASAGRSASAGASGSGPAAGSGGMSMPTAGSTAGSAASASGTGGGSAAAGGCTRDSLKANIDSYFKALAAHDPAMLPQGAMLKFTENAKTAKLGEGLVWKTAGAVKFTRSLLDTERCGSVTEAVIPNSDKDTIYGLRLKVENQQLTEIESIVVDPANGFFPTPMGILNSKADAWDELVPADKRSTRAELEAAAKAYFDSFGDSSIKPPYNMPCDRLENGFKTTQGDCGNLGGAMGIKHPAQRYPLTDLEAGITAGFVLFAGADIDFHMFKVIGGKIRWINAVVGPAVTSSGWPAQ